MSERMLDAELIDDLNRFADLAERLAGPLNAQANQVDRAGEFKRAFLIHQHADQIRDAGQVARYQAREMVRGLKVPPPGTRPAGADHNCTNGVQS